MKTKKQRNIHLEKDDIIRTVEQDLIQTWKQGRLAAPTSPLDAASALTMRVLMFLKGANTFPYPPQPSEAEFTSMLVYIVNEYHLSPAFPYSNEQLGKDITTKIQGIQRRRNNA